MDIKGNGVAVSVNPAEQTNEWLVNAAQEIADVARERGLELPFATGVVAVEGALQAAETEVEAPAPDAKESLPDQLSSAFKGYSAVIDALNDGRRKKDVLPVVTEEALLAELEAWFTDDKLMYVVAAQEADPNVRFTIVATPNVLVTPKDLIRAAKAFGQSQPYETYVWDELYGKYTAQQLSGTNPDNGNAVQFNLIPSSFTPEMEGTVVEQRAKLAKLQADNPDLKVPSVLDAVTYWQTLRAQGEQLADNATFDRTYIRHFDLPEQRFSVWSRVPYSYVYVDGRSYLNFSYVQYDRGARVAVG